MSSSPSKHTHKQNFNFSSNDTKWGPCDKKAKIHLSGKKAEKILKIKDE